MPWSTSPSTRRPQPAARRDAATTTATAARLRTRTVGSSVQQLRVDAPRARGSSSVNDAGIGGQSVELVPAHHAEVVRSVEHAALDVAPAELVHRQTQLVREADGVGLRALAAGEEERRRSQRGEELSVRLGIALEHRGDLRADSLALLRRARLGARAAHRASACGASARWRRARGPDRSPTSAIASPTRSGRVRRTRGGTRRSGP